MKALTSIIFKNEIRINHGKDSSITSKIFSILAFLIVFCSLAGFMTWSSIYITQKLEEINQSSAFISIMLTGNLLILFTESIFQVLNILYFSKDLKIYLRMPIKPINIIHGKLLKLITSEYQMEIIMLAIPMLVYGVVNCVNWQFYLYIPIILIILPIIPISITAILVTIIINFTNNIKNKSKVMYITIIIAIVIMALNSNQQLKLIVPIINALINYNDMNGGLNFAIYVFSSLLIYIITLMVISPLYLRGAIGTTSSGERQKNGKNYILNIDDFKQTSYKRAYLRKEYLIIKRGAIFFIQCIIMPIILAITTLFVVGILMLVISNLEKSIVKQLSTYTWFTGVFLAIGQIFYMLNFSSIIAISKEHKWAILSKYIPIKLSEQIKLKLRIGKVINFISNIGVIILYYIFTKNFIYTVCLTLISYGLNTIGEKIKIFIDLHNPKIDWDNEYSMMKQNTNVMFELFYTMVIVAIFIGLGFIIRNLNVYYCILIIIILISNMVINEYIYNKENKIFENLS